MKRLIICVITMLVVVSCARNTSVAPGARGNVDVGLVNDLEIRTKELTENQGVHGSVAGLLAILKIIEEEQRVIKGFEIIQIINELNPGLQRMHKLIEAIESIEEVKPEGNTFIFNLINDKPIYIDKMKIKDGSSILITSKDRTTNLVIKEGIDVGLGFIRFDVNNVCIYQHNGDMEFTYGSNKTKKMNMEKDILR